MKVKIFTINVLDSSDGIIEMNSFLSMNRVLSLTKELAQVQENAYWTFVLEYQEKGNYSEQSKTVTKKIDYKEVLSETDFAVYSRLRELRKEIANKEAVPVYTVFTNEQLAQMVQNKVLSKSDLKKIAGVGESKIDKYSEKFLEILKFER